MPKRRDAVPEEIVFGLKPGNSWPANDVQTFPRDRMDLATEHMKVEMPAEMDAASVQPRNRLEEFLLGGRGYVAETSPVRRITYDPQALPEHQADVDDVLAHELTHVKQFLLDMINTRKNQGKSYMERPHEIEAFQKETDRRVKRRDVELPKDKR